MRWNVGSIVLFLAGCGLLGSGLCPANAGAQDPYRIAWIRQFDEPAAHTVIVDDLDNVHVGVGSSIRRYNPAGELLDTVRFEAPARTFAYDSSGNIYACAAGWDDWSVGAGHSDVVVSKLDPQGSIIWVRQWGTPGYDSCEGIAVDPVGNVYAGGYDNFRSQALVRKFDPQGNEIWTRRLDASSQGHTLAVDAIGNSFIAGYGNVVDPPAGNGDAFAAKYNSLGDLQWARQFASSRSENAYGIALDDTGNVYTTGETDGLIEPTPFPDAFVAKVDPDGNRVWTAQFGTFPYQYEQAYAVTVDKNGDVFVVGETSTSPLPVYGVDGFLAKLNASGELLWTRNITSTLTDVARAVAVDSLGNVYVAGDTDGNVGSVNSGGYDGFLVKFAAPIPEPSTWSIIAVGGLLLGLKRVVRGGLDYVRRAVVRVVAKYPPRGNLKDTSRPMDAARLLLIKPRV